MTPRHLIHIVGPLPSVLIHKNYRLSSQQAHPTQIIVLDPTQSRQLLGFTTGEPIGVRVHHIQAEEEPEVQSVSGTSGGEWRREAAHKDPGLTVNHEEVTGVHGYNVAFQAVDRTLRQLAQSPHT